MPSLQVRDLPKPIYDKLKALAERERRSMAQQVVVLLEQALATKEEHIMRRKELMNRILAMGLGSIDVFYVQKALIQHAFDLALDNGLSVYDSLYLSLCSTTGHKLLSWDKRLNEVAKQLKFVLER